MRMLLTRAVPLRILVAHGFGIRLFILYEAPFIAELIDIAVYGRLHRLALLDIYPIINIPGGKPLVGILLQEFYDEKSG